jgi:hydrogenase-4 component F
MNILSELGPVGVIVLALIGRRFAPDGLRKVIAIWVTLVFMSTLVWAYPQLHEGGLVPWLLVGTNLIATTSAWDSVWWGREHSDIKTVRYYIWWSLFWASLISIAVSENLILSWLAIEFSTLVSGALIVEMRNRRALEAAWKYIIIASVGLFMAIIGVLFIYASLRTHQLGWHTLDYANIRSHAATIPLMVKEISTILIVSGIGTKVGLVPFHTWLPDAHSEAPAPVSGLLSGVLLGLCLVTIERLLSAISTIPTSAAGLLTGPHLLLILGTLSVVVGTFALLAQKDVKRLLAYSSIEQMGIAALAFGINTPFAREAALLQLAFHAVIKSSLFYVSGHLSVAYRSTRLVRMTNLFYRTPRLAVLWAVGVFALAGLPPLGLAYSEWMILLGLWQAHLWVVLASLTISLVLGFSALVYHLLKGMWGNVEVKECEPPGVQSVPLDHPLGHPPNHPLDHPLGNALTATGGKHS